MPEQVAPITPGPRFVGRERERADIVAALEEAKRSRGRVVLVTGDGGIGKTRLCEEAEGCALDQGFTVVWGHALETGAPPYWPWIQIVRSLRRSAAGPEILRAIGPAADDLGLLAPELRAAGAAPGGLSQDDPAAVYRLSEAVVALIRAASVRRPLLLVLDDLHTADASSLRLLQFVTVEIRDARVLVLGTRRETEVRLAPALARIFGELARRATTVTLRRMEKHEVAEIMSHVVGAKLPGAIVTPLYERSGGNPLFACELARYLSSADPTLSSALAAARTMPSVIADVIVGRVELLSAQTREVLVAAAVGGSEVETDLVAKVCRRERETCLAALDEAVQAGLAASRDGGRCLAFTQSLIRDALYRSVPIARRAELHHAWGLAAESAYASALEPRYAELAYHFSMGATLGGREKVSRYHRLAGERAATGLAFDEAARHFARALSAAEPDGDRVERCEVLLALGDALRASGEVAAAVETFAKAAALARELRAPPMLARVALSIGRRASPTQANPLFAELAAEALANLGEEEPALRAQLLARLSAEVDAGSPPRRATLGRQAIALAREVGDPAALAAALLGAFHALWTAENLDERIAIASEVETIAARLARRDLALEAGVIRFLTLVELDDVPGAESELARCGQLAAELRSPYHQWLVQVHATMIALVRGQLADAERLAEEAYQLGERCGVLPEARVHQLLILWQLRKEQGRLAELAAKVEAMVAEAPQVPLWRILLAQVKLAAGDGDAARGVFARLMEGSIASWPHDMLWLGSMAALAEIAVALRDAAALSTLEGALAPFAGRNAIVGRGAVSLGPVALVLGRLALAAGRDEAARAHLERAVASAQHGRCELFAAHAARALAQTPAAASPSADPPAVGVAPGAVIRLTPKDGEWLISCGGSELAIRDSKGMRYLAELVNHPGRELHVTELVGEDQSADDNVAVALDARAREAARARLEDLQDALAEAERFQDHQRAHAARVEIERFTDEVALALGGERDRKAGASTERLRQSVTKRVRDAIKRIGERDAQLAKHLNQAVRTGAVCVYIRLVTPGDGR